jgi:Amt family ammonium transporter
MGILAGSVPWFTMMVVHKRSRLLQQVDDTLGVFHTHAVAGVLGGFLVGLFAEPTLSSYFLPVQNSRGGFYGGRAGGLQVARQIVGALFIVGWNVVSTTLILLFIKLLVPLRMSDEELLIGDDAAHGEEAYALWGDGEKFEDTQHSLADQPAATAFSPYYGHGTVEL